jgi:hypothetical protein
MSSFGASAPVDVVFEGFGITSDAVVAAAKRGLITEVTGFYEETDSGSRRLDSQQASTTQNEPESGRLF